ncbi:MAG: hypothetical protein LBQ40_03850 [Clostridiales bacterium]|jgi:cell division protein FtsX|nr:hypothetical protein [Clostridiales bacterium]
MKKTNGATAGSKDDGLTVKIRGVLSEIFMLKSPPAFFISMIFAAAVLLFDLAAVIIAAVKAIGVAVGSAFWDKGFFYFVIAVAIVNGSAAALFSAYFVIKKIKAKLKADAPR